MIGVRYSIRLARLTFPSSAPTLKPGRKVPVISRPISRGPLIEISVRLPIVCGAWSSYGIISMRFPSNIKPKSAPDSRPTDAGSRCGASRTQTPVSTPTTRCLSQEVVRRRACPPKSHHSSTGYPWQQPNKNSEKRGLRRWRRASRAVVTCHAGTKKPLRTGLYLGS